MGRIKNNVKGESNNNIVLDDEIEEDCSIIHLYIITPQDGGRSNKYKFHKEGRIKNVLMRHCNKYDIDYDTAKFVYKGKKLKAKKSPVELEMKDGDEIFLMMFKFGG